MVTSARLCAVVATLGSAALPAAATSLAAQASSRAGVEQERADYVAWLRDAGVSPFRAIALRPLDSPVSLGPAGSDIPLPDVEAHRLVPQGAVAALEHSAGRRLVPRHRAVAVGPHTLLVSGPRERAVVTVFGPERRGGEPSFYPYDPSLAFTGPMTPAAEPRTTRILAPDGVEVDATEAGTVALPIAGATHRLRVLRVPVPGTEESELEIYFRDSTNDRGTYPAGRFVALVPLADGRYRLDFNRARNPFCAYNTVYPCPVPWAGNALPVPISAGERYVGGEVQPEAEP
jgi:hypothetical protein